MKTMFLLMLISASAFAKVSLKVDFKDFSRPKTTQFKQILSADFDEKKTFVLPDSNQEIDIVISEKLPAELRNRVDIRNSALIDFKLFEKNQGQRKLVNAGRVVTKWGSTASMKKFSDASGKKPLMTLKVIPTKL